MQTIITLVVVILALAGYTTLQNSNIQGLVAKNNKLIYEVTSCEANNEAVESFLSTGSIDPILDRMQSSGWVREDSGSLQEVDKYKGLKD